MNKKLSGIVGIILSIILLIYFETFSYKLFDLIGLNIYNYSNTIRIIINLVINFVMCFIVYLIYKKDFRKSRRNDNIFKILLMFIIGLISLVVIMYLFDYIVRYLGKLFKVNILDISFYNIFDKKLEFSLIVKIITDYIIRPYLYCSIIILSMDKFARRNDTFIILSGILASIVYALSLSGTLGYVIINSLSTFLLFAILAFLYRKSNSIWFSIMLYSLYLVSNVIIINYIGW